MIDEKVHCMLKAKEYEKDYWDGDRRYGYGVINIFQVDGNLAESLIKEYQLDNDSSILDVGCGKAFLLHEIKLILPDIKISGFDISNHGLECATDEIKKDLFIHKAQELYPFKDKEFDLVISLGCLHNLRLFELQVALKEIQRVGKNGYVMLESYRNELEQFNLQCWALTRIIF